MNFFKKIGMALGIVGEIAGTVTGNPAIIVGAKAIEEISKDKTDTKDILSGNKTEALLDVMEAAAKVLSKRSDNKIDDKVVSILSSIRKEFQEQGE